MKNDPHDISVCICTYKRPAMLKNLIDKILIQSTNNEFTYDVVVVDNDCNKSGYNVVSSYIPNDNNILLSYDVEIEQNISLARNRAVIKSKGYYIVFIDDDEIPETGWLISIYRKCIELKADGVCGPVIPMYENDAPKWIVRGKFYERPRHRTGELLSYKNTRTGNVIIRRDILLEEMFDPKLGSGGEDKDLFRRLINNGHKFYWNDESIVYEIINKHRMSRLFLLKRALLRGKMSVNNPIFQHIDILKSVTASAVYLIVIPFTVLFGQHITMSYLVKLFDHMGKILTYINKDIIQDGYIS